MATKGIPTKLENFFPLKNDGENFTPLVPPNLMPSRVKKCTPKCMPKGISSQKMATKGIPNCAQFDAFGSQKWPPRAYRTAPSLMPLTVKNGHQGHTELRPV